ncbi:MAG: hypothetical protein Q9219_006871 [cf. Caloplaca sp. 3 TL-2023]
MGDPVKPASSAGSTFEDDSSYYKAQYEQLEAELADFQTSSRELEAELERDIEAAEKKERQLQEKIESLSYEVEEWKTKYKQSKTEANHAQNSLEKEITSLRDTNRTMQLRLRDIEVANDDFERQARHTTSSLEDLESKYNIAIERGVMFEEEIKLGEHERETLRIETQRLRDELGELRVEADIRQDKLRRVEAAAAGLQHKRRTEVDVSTVPRPQSAMSEQSELTTMSSPTIPTPPTKSTSSTISETPTPPSPPTSDHSIPPASAPAPAPSIPIPKSRLSISDTNTTPRPQYSSRTPSNRKRAGGGSNGSSIGVSTPDYRPSSRLSFGIPQPSPSRDSNNRSPSRASISSRTSISHLPSATGATAISRPGSRQSMTGTRTPLGNYSTLTSQSESRRPRSSIGGSYANMHSNPNHGHSASVSRLSNYGQNFFDEEGDSTNDALTPTPARRTNALRDDASSSCIPSMAPVRSKNRYSGVGPGRRISSGLGEMGPPERRETRKLSGVGETF